jgi:hypothetical protein
LGCRPRHGQPKLYCVGVKLPYNARLVKSAAGRSVQLVSDSEAGWVPLREDHSRSSLASLLAASPRRSAGAGSQRPRRLYCHAPAPRCHVRQDGDFECLERARVGNVSLIPARTAQPPSAALRSRERSFPLDLAEHRARQLLRVGIRPVECCDDFLRLIPGRQVVGAKTRQGVSETTTLLFTKQVKDLGIQELLGAPRAPQQRAYIERVIGTIRRESLGPCGHLQRGVVVRVGAAARVGACCQTPH